MQKLDQQTPNFTDEHIANIATMFPHCVVETKKEDGSLKKVIDFDLLKQELSHNIVDGPSERYRMDWPGKRESLVSANTPITKTLRPSVDESVDFDTTENLYIEGDNLDALKLLQKNYLGAIKMIYIDPPYNTGKDFVYKDNFTRSKEEELEASGQVDADGGRLVANLESNGRFHSDWLSMMYPRLRLARNLLKDDGVIFISIDDNEVHNLRKICDEIFGEDNFVGEFVREAIKGGSQSRFFRQTHDYILVYGKFLSNLKFSGFKKEDLKLPLADANGPYARGRELNKWGAGSRREDSPSMWYPIPGPNGEDIFPIRNDGSEGRWRFGKESMKKLLAEGNAIFENRDNGSWVVYEKLRGNKTDITQFISILKDKYLNAKATEELKLLFDKERAIFDFSKPSVLLQDLILLADVQDNELVLDFFSGSSSTVQGLFSINAEDGKKRKFIMVQLPEETDEKSEAYKAGYKTIAEIGKERIRRVGKKIKEENADKEGIEDLDTGFRVLKIDESNMKDIYFSPSEVDKASLFDTVDHIKEDRSAEDLLFGVLVDWGVELTLPIQREEILGKTVFFVGHGSLTACFDEGLDEVFITELARRETLKVVFKESGFQDDETKINAEQIFTQLSPSTELRVI